MLHKALAGGVALLLACRVSAAEPSDAAVRDAQLRALEDLRRTRAQRHPEPLPVVPTLQLAPPTGLRRAPVPDEQPCRVIHSLQLTGSHAARFS